MNNVTFYQVFKSHHISDNRLHEFKCAIEKTIKTAQGCGATSVIVIHGNNKVADDRKPWACIVKNLPVASYDIICMTMKPSDHLQQKTLHHRGHGKNYPVCKMQDNLIRSSALGSCEINSSANVLNIEMNVLGDVQMERTCIS